MADANSNAEDPLSDIGHAVKEIVRQVQEVRRDVKLEFRQNDDDDDIDDWAQYEKAYDDDIRQIESIDLTQDDDDDFTTRKATGGEADKALRCEHSKNVVRNACLCGTHDRIDCHSLGQHEIRKEKVYELVGDHRVGRYIVDFVAVKQLWRHRNKGSIVIRGAAYARTRNLDGLLRAYKSEVCRVTESDSNDARPREEQSMIEVTPEELLPRARNLHHTNKPFPECRFDPRVFITPEERDHMAHLTCRWALEMVYPDKRFRHNQRPIAGEALTHLNETDVPKKKNRTSDAARRADWRGDSRRGSPNLAETATKRPKIVGQKACLPRKKYTAADMFSGAGGYTTGAKSAGIKVARAVDHWPRCNATYKANHPEVDLYEQDIMAHCNDFTKPDERFDFVHLSPPCQTWSPAHTCAGKNDSANIAALSACQHIVRMLRPRIVTFEQTFGITQERHLPYFNALIQSLTKYDYSLRWKVVSLVEYGLPQNRKRLMMIGAAPGEQLPPFPTPTHAAEPVPGDNKKRFVSAIKACGGLVPGEGMHNPAEVKQVERAQWNCSQPMNRTITTSGGQAYHWDGQRDLTLAEFARLQGFPEDYRFIGPCIKKQIGNAVPPVFAQAFMGQLKSGLEKVDGVDSGPKEEDYIKIDDDDDDDGGGGGYDVQGFVMSGNNIKHEPTYEPNVLDGHCEHIEDVDADSPGDEATASPAHESMGCAVSPNAGVGPAGRHGDGSRNDVLSPSTNTATDSMDSLSVPPAAQLPQEGTAPRRRSSRSCSSRRRSSGGSSASVQFLGQRPLATIVEDFELSVDQASSQPPASGDQVGRASLAFALQAPPGSRFSRARLPTQVAMDEDNDYGSSSSSENFDDTDERQYEDMEEYGREDDGLPLLHDSPSPSPPRQSARPSASELCNLGDDAFARLIDALPDDKDDDDDKDDAPVAAALGAIAPPGSPTGLNPFHHATGLVVPSFAGWTPLIHQAQASHPGWAGIPAPMSGAQAGGSWSRGQSELTWCRPAHMGSSPLNVAKWQDADVSEEEAMAWAMEMSRQDAVGRHEQSDFGTAGDSFGSGMGSLWHAPGMLGRVDGSNESGPSYSSRIYAQPHESGMSGPSSDGPGMTGPAWGEDTAGSFCDPPGTSPFAPQQAPEEPESDGDGGGDGEGEGKGKGKGKGKEKAVVKRSHGDAPGGPDIGSPSKRGRTG